MVIEASGDASGFGLGRRKSLVEKMHRHTGFFCEPLAKRAGFVRFLAFAAVEMDREADDEPRDVFVSRGVTVLSASRVKIAGVVRESVSAAVAAIDSLPFESRKAAATMLAAP